MAVRQRNQAVVLAKVQDAFGSLPVFDPATDALQIIDVDLNYVRDSVAREIIKNTLGATGEVVTATYVEVSLTLELKGSGNGGSGNLFEPRIGRLIQGCGYKKSGGLNITGESVGTGDGVATTFTLANAPVAKYSETVYVDGVAQTRGTDYTINYDTGEITFATAPAAGAVITADYSTPILYTPSSAEFGTADRPACAFEIYYGMSGTQADKYVVADAAGNYTINFEVGRFPTVQFTFTGRLVSGPETVAVPSGIAYEDTEPQPCVGANLTIDGRNDFVLTALTIESGNEIAMRRDMNAADGYIGAFMSRRRIVASIDPEATLASDYDWIAKLKSGVDASLSIGPIGDQFGNIVTITAPKAQYTGVSHGEREGILIFNVDLLLTESSGDDEITIKFE